MIAQSLFRNARARRGKYALLGRILGGVLFLFVALNLSTTDANAIIGSGGDPLSGGGAAHSSKGWGWHVFPVDGGLVPRGFRTGPQWAQVRQQCVDAGTNQVIAFTVLEVMNGSAATGIVYQYKSVWYGPPRYSNHRNSGGGWISVEEAYNRFMSTPDDKTGWRWGDNVAWFCYSDAAHWSTSADSYIRVDSGAETTSNVSVLPNNVVTWRHWVRNDGPQNMDRQIGYQVSGWAPPGVTLPAGNTAGGVGSIFINIGISHRVTQDDVGNTMCQGMSWGGIAWDNGNWSATGARCATAPYTYTLLPEVPNITDGNMIESAAGALPVQGRVRNEGPTKSHTNIRWQVTQMRYAPGVAVPNTGGGYSPNDPCRYFSVTGPACSVLSSGNEVNGYGNGAVATYSPNGNIGDEPVGTRICFAMSVVRGSSATTDWRHSRPACLVVGKKPKIQAYGSDVIVGRGYTATGTKVNSGVTTSISNKSGTYYGSWSEYGIIPSGRIVGMASASGFAVGVSSGSLCGTGVGVPPLNLLSFSNTPCLASLGNYQLTTASQYDAIRARFAAPTGAPSLTGDVQVSNLAGGTIYSGTGSINLTSTPTATVTPMPAGKWVIINAPEADVRISSDLTYTDGPLTNAADIPQLVIIARNIVIDDGVGRIDAWLYAKGEGVNGTVNTCDASDPATPAVTQPSELTSSVCSNQLVVNGPVVSNHLLLYRTYGSGTGDESGTPAEVFNLRPDAYMWATAFSGVGTKARTVITTELPPRF